MASAKFSGFRVALKIPSGPSSNLSKNSLAKEVEKGDQTYLAVIAVGMPSDIHELASLKYPSAPLGPDIMFKRTPGRNSSVPKNRVR